LVSCHCSPHVDQLRSDLVQPLALKRIGVDFNVAWVRVEPRQVAVLDQL
jgi:hypothetical protein